LINGRAFKPKEWSEMGLPIIRIQNLNNPDAKYNYFDGELADKHRIGNGDLLFAWSGTPGTSFGAHVWKGETAALNQHIFKIEFRETLIDKRFLRYAINQTLDELISGAHGGVGLRHVTKGKFEANEISFPSLAEQKVIVDKLDTLLAQVENTKARLERIPQILKRFRQSVLAAAVSGRLTEAAHASSSKQVTVGQIASDIRYGTSKKCSESTGSTPVLRIPNIGDGYVLQSNLKFADFEEKERAKLSLKQGDLLLIRSNGSLDLVGKTALVREIDSGLLYAGYLIRLRLDEQVAEPAYVSLCLRSPETRAVIEEKARSTSGVNNVNSKELASLELSLPSTAVQQEIVRRVDQLFDHADRIEQQVNNALDRVNNLTQSILAKAFRGELTEQWRKDNPDLISGENSAEALLERIKAERAAMKKPAKKARKQTTA
jgi:type I restriction enzyme S subunit